MRRYSLCLTVIVIAMLLFASCNPCKRGGSGGDCSHVMFLYLFNASSVKVQLGDNTIVNPGERVQLAKIDDRGLFPSAYFTNDTAIMIFNDSILFIHCIKSDAGRGREYVPLYHNILDIASWDEGNIDDSYESWGVYTITDEDYQAALQQSEK